MKKKKYIEMRDEYYQEAKEKSEIMMRLRREYTAEKEMFEKLKSELKVVNQNLSKMILDISCKEQTVFSLKKDDNAMRTLNSQLSKAKDDLKQFETIEKVMRNIGTHEMTNLIDKWISYCNVYIHQIR